MKVIFLDIDGVLNCEKTPNPRKFPYIVDAELIAGLRQLLDELAHHRAFINVAIRPSRHFQCHALWHPLHRCNTRLAD